MLFHDGFLKNSLPAQKISKVDAELIRNEVKNFTDIGTKEERRERKRKINVAELFHINKRSKKKGKFLIWVRKPYKFLKIIFGKFIFFSAGLVHSKSTDVKTYPVNRSRVKKTLPTTGETEATDAEAEITPAQPETPKQPDTKTEINVTPATPARNLVENIPCAVEVKYHDGRSEMWSKQYYQRSEGRTAGKVDIVIMT